MDAKYNDVEAMDDGSIDVCLFNGGIRNDENAEIAHLLRRKSKVLVAFGSCASEGCIPGLANLARPRRSSRRPSTARRTDNPDAHPPAADLDRARGRARTCPRC